jgi:phenolic acid decarboxylase
MKNTLYLPQRPVTILSLKPWLPQASLKIAPLQVGQLSLKWTRRLLVNPKTIPKHLQPKTFTEFAKEIPLSTSIRMPLATKNTNLHQRFFFPRWKNKNATCAFIHTTSDVRDFVSPRKAKKLAFVIPLFALQLFIQHTHITLMF